MKTAHGDRRVELLVELAREHLTEEPPRRDEALAFRRFEARLGRSSRPHVAWRSFAFAAVPLAAAAGAALLFTALRAPDLTYRVVNGADVAGTVKGGAGTRIHFSDGSEIALERGAETKIEHLGAHGGRVDLEAGSVHVAIQKADDAEWFVEAGPYTIRVTGTAFDVRWSEAERRFEVALYSGSVVVTGPNAQAGYRLRPGQRLVASADAPMLVESGVTRRPTTASDDGVAAAAPGAALPAAPPSRAELAPSPLGAASPRPAEAQSWRRKVAEGHFDEVLRAAESRGLPQTLAGASLEDLSALADAARYARRVSIAERALAAQRERFPGSGAARDAAFFLGRLSSGSRAVDWYDRYLKESPNGAYASQALGRKMMAIYEARGAAAARGLALDYVARYPKGAYASAAQKIERETTPR